MSATALICSGASDGPRAENLLEAGAQLLAEPGTSLAAVSGLYGDRHYLHTGDATLNLVLALDWRDRRSRRRWSAASSASKPVSAASAIRAGACRCRWTSTC
ncbi:hypothetical protein FE772_15055 [Lysobacter enzymogenes]|nr:hypothetical protein [Lysobacter enzymogenes]QCW26770.1 hypothetical protein FE772_15055 [Lysobacter enzymogenes]